MPDPTLTPEQIAANRARFEAAVAADKAQQQQYYDTLFSVLRHEAPLSALEATPFNAPDTLSSPVELPDITVSTFPWPLLAVGAAIGYILITMDKRPRRRRGDY